MRCLRRTIVNLSAPISTSLGRPTAAKLQQFNMDDKSSARVPDEKDKLEGMLLLTPAARLHYVLTSNKAQVKSADMVMKIFQPYLDDSTDLHRRPKRCSNRPSKLRWKQWRSSRSRRYNALDGILGMKETEPNTIGHRTIHQERGMRKETRG